MIKYDDKRERQDADPAQILGHVRVIGVEFRGSGQSGGTCKLGGSRGDRGD